MVTRLWGHEETIVFEFLGENEGKNGDSAQGGVLISLYGYFR